MNTPVRVLIVSSLAIGAASAQERTATPAAQPPLDLRVAKLTELFTPGQLREVMRLDEAEMSTASNGQSLDTVIVEGAGQDSPRPTPMPSGFGAILWGVAHPLQLWRIFAPAPSE